MLYLIIAKTVMNFVVNVIFKVQILVDKHEVLFIKGVMYKYEEN